MKRLRQLGGTASLLLALTLPALSAANPDASADETGIREVMLSTWDTPQTRLDIGPVVIQDRWAVAGWTQGQRGGRAFLTRNAHGEWQVSVCGGDGRHARGRSTNTGAAARTSRSGHSRRTPGAICHL